MFQAPASGQQVVGDVEHVVAVVVGQVDLQQAEMTVDGLGQSEFADHQMHRPDAARGRGPHAAGNFVMDIGGRHDGLVAAAVVVLVQAASDLPLASFDLMAYLGIHSKTSVRWGEVVLGTHHKPHKTPKVFGLFLLQVNPTAPGSLG